LARIFAKLIVPSRGFRSSELLGDRCIKGISDGLQAYLSAHPGDDDDIFVSALNSLELRYFEPAYQSISRSLLMEMLPIVVHLAASRPAEPLVGRRVASGNLVGVSAD
jgi:hypothetical protein